MNAVVSIPQPKPTDPSAAPVATPTPAGAVPTMPADAAGFATATAGTMTGVAPSAGGMHRERRQRASSDHGPFVPLLLGGIALLLSFAYQTYQLWVEGTALQTAHAGQQQTVDKAGQLRASLDAIAADTQRLADAGNANARLLVEELRKRGITINPAAAPAAAAPAKP